MLFKFIFPLLFLFTAVAAKENKSVSAVHSGTPTVRKLHPETIPMPPADADKPLVVKISADILTSTIDQEKQIYEATLFFRQEWYDPRLTFKSKDKGEFRWVKDPESIWMPDLFFANDMRNETDTKSNITYIKRFPDGRIYTAERKTFKTSCPINLTKYPFDTQICELKIESYKHPIQDIIIRWNESDKQPPITDRFLDHSYITTTKAIDDKNKCRDTKYSSARIEFSLTRTPVGVIFRVILPIVVITLCSWISFLLSREEIGIRLSLCMSPIMTYMLQINLCVAFFVSPSYLTGLDVWAGTSFIAMFVSGVECIFMICKDGPEEYMDSRELKEREFRNRVFIALFVSALDIISIASVFMSRLL